MTFIFRKYKEWWKILSQVKLLSINNHSLTYEVSSNCAECIFLLFFVINALEVLWLPVPVHVQYNTNKNIYWAWLLRKSVFVVLWKKGTTQTERADILGKEIRCTRRLQIQFLTAPLGMMARLCGGVQGCLQAPFAMSGLWCSCSQGWLFTQVYTAWLCSILHPCQQPQWREYFLTQGCPGLDFLPDINSQSTMWETSGWRQATGEVPLLLAAHQQRAVVFSWRGETASVSVYSPWDEQRYFTEFFLLTS